MILLQLEQVCWRMDNFCLEVSASLSGKVTGIFGPSGAGKTSLLEVIAGLRRPQSGRITLGSNILLDTAARINLPPEDRAVAYVPQDGALFPHLNVQRNLMFGYRSDVPRPAAFTLDHVLEVLELRPLVQRSPRSLSGGEKQRVALGRALLASPRLLLLDEPLAGLDAALKARVLPYLLRIRVEFDVPMIYVTHSPDEIVAVCDDVVCLEGGQVAHHAAPGILFEESSSRHYRARERKQQ